MKRAFVVPILLLAAACSRKETSVTVAAAAPPRPTVTAPAPKGAEVHAASSAAPAVEAPATADAGQLQRGEQVFNDTCATCHMADGNGVPNLQPAIVGSAWLSNPDPQLLLSLILRGSVILGEGAKAYQNDMAPQDHLSDADIAAVATYVRGRFGTPPVTKPVTPAEVSIARRRPGLP